MLSRSMWWIGLMVFGLMIGGIQSLGAWVRPVAAPAQVARTDDVHKSEAARRHMNCQPAHWRSAFLHH